MTNGAFHHPTEENSINNVEDYNTSMILVASARSLEPVVAVNASDAYIMIAQQHMIHDADIILIHVQSPDVLDGETSSSHVHLEVKKWALRAQAKGRFLVLVETPIRDCTPLLLLYASLTDRLSPQHTYYSFYRGAQGL